MDKWVKLFQSNTSCIIGNKIYFVTESEKLVIEMELPSFEVNVFNGLMLENRVEFIGSCNNCLFAVDIAGKWICEINLENNKVFYYSLNCNRETVNNFCSISIFHNKIYIFMRHENNLYIFDCLSKKLVCEKLNICDDPYFIKSCRAGNKIYLFSIKYRNYYVYHLDNKKLEKNSLSIEDELSGTYVKDDSIYLLSNNVVYDLNNNYNVVAKIENENILTKIVKVKNVMYFLPGLGSDIFKYNLENHTYEKLLEYPCDYQYDIPEGWGKFIGRVENETYIIWNMRSNNYFFIINKNSGAEKFVKPKFINMENDYWKREFWESGFETRGCIKESIFTLNDFIEYIKSY